MKFWYISPRLTIFPVDVQPLKQHLAVVVACAMNECLCSEYGV